MFFRDPAVLWEVPFIYKAGGVVGAPAGMASLVTGWQAVVRVLSSQLYLAKLERDGWKGLRLFASPRGCLEEPLRCHGEAWNQGPLSFHEWVGFTDGVW